MATRQQLWTSYKELVPANARTMKWPAVKVEGLSRAINQITTLRRQEATGRYSHNIKIIYIDADDEKRKEKTIKFTYTGVGKAGNDRGNYVADYMRNAQDSWIERRIIRTEEIGTPLFIPETSTIANIPMRGECLTYPTKGMMPDAKLNIKAGECCYSHIMNELKFDTEAVKSILGMSATYGAPALTSNQVVAVFRHANKSVKILDLDTDIIDEYKDENEHGGIAVYYCHNGHLSKPSIEATKAILARRNLNAKQCEAITLIDGAKQHEDKKEPKPAISRTVATWKEAMSCFYDELEQMEGENPDDCAMVLNNLKRDFDAWKLDISNRCKSVKGSRDARAQQKALIATERDAGKNRFKIQIECAEAKLKEALSNRNSIGGQKTNIFIEEAENLYPHWLETIENHGKAYDAVISDQTTIPIVKLPYGIRIIAGRDRAQAIAMASDLSMEVKCDGVVSLGERVWNHIAGDKWVKSVMNNEVAKMMTAPQGTRLQLGGVVYTPSTFLLQKGETMHGADYYKCYTSVAMRGDFYTVDVMSEVVKFDGMANRDNIYYVEATPSFLFRDVGVYDYEVVIQGLADGIINNDNIKYQVGINHNSGNDAILSEFITHIFNNVKDQNTAKLVVNSQIGKFAKNVKKGKHRTIITTNPMEAGFYYGKHKSVCSKRNVAMICQYQKRDVYMVSGFREQFSHATDILINGAISQRARVLAWRLMKDIERMPGARIVCVKTDSVKYVCKTQYPTTTERRFGAIRYENCAKLAHHEFKATKFDASGLTPYKLEKTGWNMVAPGSDPIDVIMGLNRILITGYAGTGKSYIARELEKRLIAQGKRVKMASFTHLASINVGGNTLHSIFGMDLEGNVSAKHMAKFQDGVDVLIMDELSMFPSDVFNVITQLSPGLAIYGFGDFGQARPVGEERTDFYNSQMMKSLFNYQNMELTENKRANADFANQCRDYLLRGGVLPQGVKIIGKTDWKPEPVINICARNTDRRAMNREIVCREALRQQIRKSKYRVRTDLKLKDTTGWVITNTREYFNGDKLAELCRNRKKYAPYINNNSPDMWNPFTIPYKYLSNSRHVEGSTWCIDVSYSQKSERAMAGRQFADNAMSLQGMARRIRHTISEGIWEDCDMKNAHPTILAHLVKAHGSHTPFLDQYLANRETILADISAKYSIDKDTAKMIVISIIYGGRKEYLRYGDILGRHEWLDHFMIEMRRIAFMLAKELPERYANHIADCDKTNRKPSKNADELRTIVCCSCVNAIAIDEVIGEKFNLKDTYLRRVLCPKCAQLVIDCKKLVKKPNYEASFVSKLMGDLENRMLMAGIQLLKDRGLVSNEYVLCFDGLMVKKGVITAEIMADMEEAMKVASDGVNIKLALKPFDEPIPMPDVIEPYDGVRLNELKYVIENDLDEFPFLYAGMSVIANSAQSKLVMNNERFTVINPSSPDYADATTIIKKGKSRGDEEPTSFVILKNEYHTVAIDETRFRLNFSPAYALTCHKLQGQTITGKYYIHEFEKMRTLFGNMRNIQYTALTRGTAGDNIKIVKHEQETWAPNPLFNKLAEVSPQPTTPIEIAPIATPKKIKKARIFHGETHRIKPRVKLIKAIKIKKVKKPKAPNPAQFSKTIVPEEWIFSP
jgi:hypothetical protein